ncbi:hypothetical protein GWP43_08825 [Treponema vincentii]|uniref:Uncharacterized protein n=1 Tax=Treponema vincentii TaxID=69710 RepID=A0A6P1Y115_9SPIR|nr:hypothetical protein [Treponema vincentii]QHX43526.1 hypothetical protein GWP43_08825 [Treponema vincentii]
MKLSKKTLVTVFLLTVCFTAAFAQTPPHVELMRLSPTSMTNESTRGAIWNGRRRLPRRKRME